MSYLPLFHAFGYSEAALMSMVTGARQILTETFDPDEVLDLIESEKGTIAHGFEAHNQGLCDAQEAKPRNLSSLRTGLFAAGMHSATPGAYRGERVLKPLKALSAFGMTEVWVGAALSALDDDPPHRLESSGYPAPGYEIKVVDPETGAELPDGVPGEIRVRSYALMQGYYKKPRETAESYDADGWFRTGDMGERAPDGLPPLPRPLQGHAEGRRRERGPDGGGRAVADPTPPSSKRPWSACPMVGSAK